MAKPACGDKSASEHRAPWSVGARIRAHRQEAGLSQEALAEQLGVSRQTIGNWESDRTIPDALMLADLADALGTTADGILGSDAPRIRDRALAARREFVLIAAIVLGIQLVTMLLNGAAVGTDDPDWGGGGAFVAFRFGVLVIGCLWIWHIARREGLHTIRQMLDFASLASKCPGGRGDRVLRFIGRWFWTLWFFLAASMYAAGGVISVMNGGADITTLIAPAFMFLIVAIPFSAERHRS